MRLLLLLLPLLSFSSADDWGPYGEVCLAEETPLYNPNLFQQVPWYTIDLDLPAEQRWEVIAKTYGGKMKKALGIVKEMMNVMTGGMWDIMVDIFKSAPDRLNEPYRSEIKVMAEIAGIPLAELTILNMLYEVAKACTSLVAKDANGQVYHGRNLDFGFLFMWNTTTHTWDLTSVLKELTVNLEYIRDGKLLFKGVTFAGHLGILTGVRPNAYTISTNTRFGSTASGLLDFFFHGLGDHELLIYANRDMLTNFDNYKDAVNYIENVPLIAQGYFIMSSAQGDGMVITRSYNGTDHEDKIDTTQKDKWFVLETNYDWDKDVIYLDDRRGPGNDCMKRLGKQRVGFEGIYQVLSSKPTLNKATVYTTLMNVNTGLVQTVTRNCDDPCWFV